MRGPLFVTFRDIFMAKMENDVVIHLNLSFIDHLKRKQCFAWPIKQLSSKNYTYHRIKP